MVMWLGGGGWPLSTCEPLWAGPLSCLWIPRAHIAASGSLTPLVLEAGCRCVSREEECGDPAGPRWLRVGSLMRQGEMEGLGLDHWELKGKGAGAGGRGGGGPGQGLGRGHE